MFDTTITVGGVLHERVDDFDKTRAICTDNELGIAEHPLGSVYKQGKFGYVANGYWWWRFPHKELKTIVKNYERDDL